MDFVNLFTEILNRHHFKNWRVSLNGHKKGPVTHGSLGLTAADVVWGDWSFVVDGATHSIHAERSLTGGSAKVMHNGSSVSNAHMTLAKHIVGLPPHLSVEIDVNLGDGQRFRFDAVVV